MQIYFAPLEGITGYIYRNAYSAYFGKTDKYFTPFLAPNGKKCMNSKERNDVLPEHNEGLYVVPQILTKSAEDFIRTCKELKDFGYKEVNLNLGCPSGTVVNKGRGSGFLADTEGLKQFLDTVFEKTDVDISIKTRIGLESAEEFPELMQLFNQYPLKELIVHPRIRKDFYNGHPNMEAFDYAVKHSKSPLCYNGDILTCADGGNLAKRFEQVDKIMVGRGFLRKPFLLEQLRNNVDGESGSGQPIVNEVMSTDERERLKGFHAQLLDGYREVMSGETPVLFKMKELWFYMKDMFPEEEKLYKKIKKTKSLAEYEAVVKAVIF